MKQKIFLLFALSVFLIFNLYTISFCDWIQSGDKWQYEDKGSKIVNDFKQIGGQWYYFDENGSMATGIVEIDGDLYVFTDDGPAKYGNIYLSGKNYKTTLRGKILNPDGFEESLEYYQKEYEAQKIAEIENAIIAQRIIGKGIDSMSKAATTENMVGFNKIGNNYTYLIDGESRLIYANTYKDYFFPMIGKNTIYFDNNGCALPLTWQKDSDTLKLVLKEGQTEYNDRTIYLNDVKCDYSVIDRKMGVGSFAYINAGKEFNPETYIQTIMSGLETLYSENVKKTISDEAEKVEREKQDALSKLEREKRDLELKNKIKVANTKAVQKVIKCYDENDEEHKINLNVRIPIFVGKYAEFVNVAVDANFMQTVENEVADYCETMNVFPKTIGVTGDDVYDENECIKINVGFSNLSLGYFKISYDVLKNSWSVESESWSY